MLVAPVYAFAPERVSVPAPILVKAPLVAVDAPEMVSVLVVISNVAVLPVLIVKLRSVLAVAPVYCKVPPLKIRFVAALVACPRFPATPPLPIVPTLKTPPVSVVTPV